jgi:hypothetical protein
MYWARYVLGWPEKTGPKEALFLHIGMGWQPHVPFFAGWDGFKIVNWPGYCSSHGKHMATNISQTSHSISKR